MISDEDKHEFLRLKDRTSTHGVLALLDSETVGYVDHDLAAMLGYAREELPGKPLAMVLPEHVHDHHAEDVRAFKASNTQKEARGMKNRDRTIAGIHRDKNDDGTKRIVEFLSTIHVVNGYSCVFVLSPSAWRENLVRLLGDRS